jgi:multimeric flavodoxin WrbA
MARHLLIVYHSRTGNTERMAQAVHDGATDPAIGELDVRFKHAAQADADDLLWAHGVLLGTPENFGYMSGALKDFFDRTFYEVEGKIQPLPCSIFISAGTDGSGALTSIRRIANGYPLIEVQEPLIAIGDVTDDVLARARELGMALAAGIEAGIY